MHMKHKIDPKLEEQILLHVKNAITVANNSFFNNTEYPLLYHYSTIESLFSGILVKERESDDKAISLFATDHRYLNDEKEIKHGCDVLSDIMKEKFQLDFSDDDTILKDNTNTYIISFSKESDSLPMWSSYGNRGDGIAFGFDSKIVTSTLERIFPCLYNRAELVRYIVLTLTKLEELNPTESQTDAKRIKGYQLGYLTASIIPLLKNEFYRYENEVRFATSKIECVKYRYRNNLIIPYTIQYLPKSALKRIVIGPDLNFNSTKLSIREYIDSLGFTDVEIECSRAPYRNM